MSGRPHGHTQGSSGLSFSMPGKDDQKALFRIHSLLRMSCAHEKFIRQGNPVNTFHAMRRKAISIPIAEVFLRDFACKLSGYPFAVDPKKKAGRRPLFALFSKPLNSAIPSCAS
jgi:hypothetical protein